MAETGTQGLENGSRRTLRLTSAVFITASALFAPTTADARNRYFAEYGSPRDDARIAEERVETCSAIRQAGRDHARRISRALQRAQEERTREAVNDYRFALQQSQIEYDGDAEEAVSEFEALIYSTYQVRSQRERAIREAVPYFSQCFYTPPEVPEFGDVAPQVGFTGTADTKK